MDIAAVASFGWLPCRSSSVVAAVRQQQLSATTKSPPALPEHDRISSLLAGDSHRCGASTASRRQANDNDDGPNPIGCSLIWGPAGSSALQSSSVASSSSFFHLGSAAAPASGMRKERYVPRQQLVRCRPSSLACEGAAHLSGSHRRPSHKESAPAKGPSHDHPYSGRWALHCSHPGGDTDLLSKNETVHQRLELLNEREATVSKDAYDVPAVQHLDLGRQDEVLLPS